jgi:hypothetical protein
MGWGRAGVMGRMAHPQIGAGGEERREGEAGEGFIGLHLRSRWRAVSSCSYLQ